MWDETTESVVEHYSRLQPTIQIQILFIVTTKSDEI